MLSVRLHGLDCTAWQALMKSGTGFIQTFGSPSARIAQAQAFFIK